MSADQIPDRVTWAVSLLNPEPSASVLEIGCGPGVAAQLICERLIGGRMLAVDRSRIAVERTTQRNSEHVASGRLRVRQTALADLSPDDPEFDLAFALNVNVFWTHPSGPELEILRRAIAPGGTLAILYGPGPASTTANGSGDPQRGRLDTIAVNAVDRGFSDPMVVSESRGSGVILRRPPA